MKALKFIITMLGIIMMAGLSVCADSQRADARTEAGLLALDTHGLLGMDADKTFDQSKNLAHDGAMGANRDVKPGRPWYIEEQRGALYSARGAAILAERTHSAPDVADEKTRLIAQTESALNWAFARQATDGSFSMPDSVPGGRKIHSTAMFVEACAHGLLLWREAGIDPAYVAQVSPQLVKAAVWLAASAPDSPNASPEMQADAKKYDYGHGHRDYEKAAALQESSLLAASKEDAALLRRAANSYIELALSPDTKTNPVTQVISGALDADGETVPLAGVNPERGKPKDRPLFSSYDSAYQALGLYYALLFAATTTDDRLKAGILDMARKGLDWESSRIKPDGEADLAGNTRVTASDTDERGPSGGAKKFQYTTAIYAFSYGAAFIPGYSRGDDVAMRLARKQRWIH